jgi:integrase
MDSALKMAGVVWIDAKDDGPSAAAAQSARALWPIDSGYALANKGHDTRAIQGWLGHRSITSTAVYTALAPNRFKDFWRD